MNASRRIGGINVTRTTAATRYECQLYVPEAELAELEPAIGDPVDWAQEYAEVTEVTRTWLADGAWIIRIVAEPRDESGLSIRIGDGDMDAYTHREFSPYMMELPLKWFGAHPADFKECTPMLDSGEEIIPPEACKFKNIFGDWAAPGDPVYDNAVSLRCFRDGTVRVAAWTGTPEGKAAPITYASRIAPEFYGKEVQTRRYTCSFVTAKDPGDISAFIGISGAFFNRCSPGRGTQMQRWKAESQKLTQIRLSNGRLATQVTRTMIEAPLGSTWKVKDIDSLWTW